MKIVHVQAYFQPHLGYQEYFLSKAMAKQGHDVHFITSDRYMPFSGLKNDERIVGVGLSTLDGFHIHRLPILIECRCRVLLCGLINKLISLEPDVIIIHGSTNFNNLFIFLNIKKFKAKIIIDEHHMSVVANKSLLASLFYKFWGIFYRYLVSRNKVKLVGVAQDCCNLLSDKYKIPIRDISLIPLGSDTEIFKFDRKKRIICRNELKLSNNKTLILYTGKINFEKDPFLILKAMLNTPDFGNIVFLFIGNQSSDYIEVNQSIINRCNVLILQAVKFNDLAAYYNACDIACWPKHASLSSLDAASTGTPIIVTDLVKERVSNNNGIAVKDGCLKELREAIIKLANDSNLRNEMGKKGTKLVKDNLSYKKISNMFLSVCDK
jgi:glycosyltransferase involved in cell wall biosynthesis